MYGSSAARFSLRKGRLEGIKMPICFWRIIFLKHAALAICWHGIHLAAISLQSRKLRKTLLWICKHFKLCLIQVQVVP